MLFKYKVQKDKEITEGQKEATDRFSLARELREEGYMPISIEETGRKGGLASINISLFNKVSLSDKIMFTNNLSGMLSAGLSLGRALAVLEKQTGKGYFNQVLKSLISNINKGNTLSEGMKNFPKVFSGVFIPMVHSGEESGNMSKILSEIGLNLKKSYDLNKKVKGAMIYPSVIFSVMIIIGIFMMIFVVPTLTQTFKELGTELPGSTKFIIWLSDSISQNILMFLTIIFLFIGSIYFLITSKYTRKYFQYLSLKIPLIGQMIKEINTARTARTLSSLLTSGVSISKSLEITGDVLQNYYYKNVIKDARLSVEKGSALSKKFKENLSLYPVMMGEMVEVGEETGNISKMLMDIATFYENEVDNKTKNLSTIIEPFLMVIIGGAVGFFAVSMITPMYSVMGNIN